MSPTVKLVLFVVGSTTLMATLLALILSRWAKEVPRSAGPGRPGPMPDNMGPASREEIESFAAYVFEALGYDGFEMGWTTAGSICMKRSILIDESFISKYRWQAKEIVLHEIAHIGRRLTDDTHGNAFYTRYVALLMRFMCQEEGEERAHSIPEQPASTSFTTITSSWDRKRKHGD